MLRVNHMWHRKNAIYPATIVGKPRQEDYYLGQFLQKLFAPLIPIVMPSVRSLWTYGDCGVHALSSAVIRESYSREALVSAFRILGEGQLSLTKMLMVTDKKIELADFRLLLKTVLERFDPQRDLFIINNTSQDPLDYTGGQVNHGSKEIWIGVGDPIRDLPYEYDEGDIAEIDRIEVFDCGCLVLSGASYEDEPYYSP
ncbi:4-hydroxybenzoate decarboxylase subunit C [compost metagenome]